MARSLIYELHTEIQETRIYWVGDNVRFKNSDYQVLINYIKGDQDRKGFIPTENFTILINEKGRRVTCHDFKELEIIP